MPCTSTAPCSPTTRPASKPSICTRTTFFRARPIRAGSPARATGYRAFGARHHQPRGRGRVRRPNLVLGPGRRTSHGLVHRTHGDPDDDEARRRGRPALRSLEAALHGLGRRALEPGRRDVRCRGVRPAVPRQLVADRDGRHHDRELCRDGCQTRLDGPPAARDRGGDRPTGGGRHDTPRRGARGGGRARAQERLALDVPRISRRGGTLPQIFRGRLVPHGRPREEGRGGLFLVRRSRRRRHQVGWPLDRTVRGRECLDGTSGRGRGGGDRQAGADRGRSGQGVRRLETGLRPVRGPAPRAPGPCAQAARPRGGAQGDRFPRYPAAHPLGQDHASAVESARAGSARR